jgi:hypothetical protein
VQYHTQECARGLPVREIQGRDRPETEEIEPTPCSSIWWKWDQIAVAPRICLFVLLFVSFQA